MDIHLPVDLRASCGWPLLELAKDQGLQLTWRDLPGDAPSGGWLRITTGVDESEVTRIDVKLADSGEQVGVIELRHAHALEPFQLKIDTAMWAKVVREGVALTLRKTGERPMWLLGAEAPDTALTPHLLVAGEGADRVAAFFDWLRSPASVQPFGWMDGCVLDALQDLSEQTGDARWTAARDAHLAVYFRDGRLVYEDPRSQPADNELRCIEETLPFGVLAKAAPESPLLQLALDYWQSITQEGGSVENEDRLVSTEGSYTIAYPMATIARVRGDKALAEQAALLLRIRKDLLRRPDGLWLRYWRKDAVRHFRSWARGVAWYLNGLGRSLEVLRGWVDTTDLEQEFKDVATWVIGLQRADGLWGCFLDAPEVSVDTSGSSGIAAALARGANAGLLSADATAAAMRTWEGLKPHLTVDGYLDGAAQSNRGGEALQRSDYRVLSPMGMGLMGQLAAALGQGEHN